MEGSVSPLLMAARLRAVARDQKRVIRSAAVSTLRDLTKMAEQRYSMCGSLARAVWGVTSKRGVWRKNYWRGRKVTQKSLGLRRRMQDGKSVLVKEFYTRTGRETGEYFQRKSSRAINAWVKDYDRSRKAAARVRARSGKNKAYPLIVRLVKTRWNGDTLRTGLFAAGIAGNIEGGTPFKPHMRGGVMERNAATGRYTQSVGASQMHPGGPVKRHQVLGRAISANHGRLSGNVRAALDGFMRGAFGG
jgi:hypothetical protein